MLRLLATSLIVLITACGCTGCGGGGSGGASAAVEPQAGPSKPPEKVLVVAFGDSTQAGMNTATPEVVVPADIATQVLREKLGHSSVTVVADGRGGTNSQQLLDGTDGSGMPWADRVRASGAQIITINHLINDGVLNGTTDAQYRANLMQLVTTAQAIVPKVMLETSNPLVPGTQLTVHFDVAGLDRKAQIMREVAAATGAALCDEYASIKAQDMVNLRWLPDGAHPHPALYQIKGQMLAECLLPLVR